MKRLSLVAVVGIYAVAMAPACGSDDDDAGASGGSAGSGATSGSGGAGGSGGSGGSGAAAGSGAADGGKCPACTSDIDCGDQTASLPPLCVGGTCRPAPGDGQVGAECWGDKQCAVGICSGGAPCDCSVTCITDSPGVCSTPAGDAGAG